MTRAFSPLLMARCIYVRVFVTPTCCFWAFASQKTGRSPSQNSKTLRCVLFFVTTMHRNCAGMFELHECFSSGPPVRCRFLGQAPDRRAPDARRPQVRALGQEDETSPLQFPEPRAYAVAMHVQRRCRVPVAEIDRAVVGAVEAPLQFDVERAGAGGQGRPCIRRLHPFGKLDETPSPPFFPFVYLASHQRLPSARQASQTRIAVAWQGQPPKDIQTVCAAPSAPLRAMMCHFPLRRVRRVCGSVMGGPIVQHRDKAGLGFGQAKEAAQAADTRGHHCAAPSMPSARADLGNRSAARSIPAFSE